VYRARDTRLDRDPAALARFRHEAQLAGSLNHPNVLTLFDVGEHDGRPYLVSELLEGESLRARLDRGPVPEADALRIALGLAEALAAAHERRIVLRDVKPENVFLLPDGRPKLLDFGIARLAPGHGIARSLQHGAPIEQTQPGTLLGSPAYMSPEQIRGEPADERSDLFALGCVLFEMLAGKRPFAGTTASEVTAAIPRDEPAPLIGASPGARSLGAIALRRLQKRPEDRFQRARDLIAVLQAPAEEAALEGGLAGFIAELKRRRVIRALLAYAVAAFAVLQIVEPVMHGFG
jgi:serine/threonine protein kinase